MSGTVQSLGLQFSKTGLLHIGVPWEFRAGSYISRATGCEPLADCAVCLASVGSKQDGDGFDQGFQCLLHDEFMSTVVENSVVFLTQPIVFGKT